ncbi:unnamed protein product [Camellia sinensis]
MGSYREEAEAKIYTIGGEGLWRNMGKVPYHLTNHSFNSFVMELFIGLISTMIVPASLLFRFGTEEFRNRSCRDCRSPTVKRRGHRSSPFSSLLFHHSERRTIGLPLSLALHLSLKGLFLEALSEEMDKNRDMRRGGASRSSPANPQVIKQSGMNNNFEGTVFSKKLKKERMRRLSVVGKVNSSNENGEMGCAGSEFEDEIRNTTSISKRFRFPQKVFHECNTVDHASVPRKLRSGKRNRESISPPFPDKKETNHGTNGVELPGIKKSRLNVVQPEDLDGSPSRPITKDEEEVVETLYALADMFPNNNKNGLDGELGKPKSWPLPEGESSRPACEGSAAPEKEEDSKSLCLSTTSEAEAVNPSLLEGSAHDSVEVKCLKESSQPSFPNSTQLLTELDNTISQRNVQAMFPMSKSEPICGKQACNSVGCNVQSELSLETG